MGNRLTSTTVAQGEVVGLAGEIGCKRSKGAFTNCLLAPKVGQEGQ